MNRLTLLLAAAAVALLFSCTHKEQPCADQEESTPVMVTFKIEGGAEANSQTKTTDVKSSNESRVNDLQIFVFNEDGTIADYKAAGAATSTSLLTSSGEKSVWAMVNCPMMTEIASEQELMARVTDLKNNRLDGFEMSGNLRATLTDGASISITVKRIVAKVTIGKITNGITSDLLATKRLELKKMYLINVSGSLPYSLTGDPLSWYNKLAHSDTPLNALLYDQVEHVLTKTSPYTKEHSFYPYPNPTVQDSHESDWCPRHTILTLEVVFDGETGYYPIVLPVLERNKSYIIEELVITRRPSPDPYEPVETGETLVGIVVADWDLGLNMGTITL